MDQDICSCGQGRIDSVKINPSLLRMREWQIYIYIWRLKWRQRSWWSSSALVDLSTQSHLWCIFDCRTKALKARSRFLHPLGNHSNLPEVFPTNCTFVAPAHFTKFMGPHRICFMCLESNPKSREPKRKENNWTLGVQLPGRSWHATCSKRVTTGFSICGRRKKQWMHQILFSDKTIRTEAIDRVFATTYLSRIKAAKLPLEM